MPENNTKKDLPEKEAKYITEIKELPPEPDLDAVKNKKEEVKDLPPENGEKEKDKDKDKVNTTKTNPEKSPQNKPKPDIKSTNKKTKITKAPELKSSEESIFDEAAKRRPIPINLKDIILISIDILSLIALFYILVKLPDKAQECRKHSLYGEN